MIAIVQIRMFGAQIVSIYNPESEEIVEQILIDNPKEIDAVIEHCMRKYEIDEIQLGGLKSFSTKIGSYIQERTLTKFNKNVKITYEE